MLGLKKLGFRGGFTLIETVAALSIFSVSLLAVAGLLRMCIYSSRDAQMLTDSVLLAEELMVERRLEENMAYEKREGNRGRYRWEVRTFATEVENLCGIEVVVCYHNQERENVYRLRSFKYLVSRLEGK